MANYYVEASFAIPVKNVQDAERRLANIRSYVEDGEDMALGLGNPNYRVWLAQSGATMTIDEALAQAKFGLDTPEYEPLVETLAAEVRRYREMRCETCRHQRDDDHVGEPCCTISLTWIPCRALNGGCLAWEKRDA